MKPLSVINCPDAVRNQIESFIGELRRHLADNLVGIYLHGSLSMGCFNPEISDIDLLAITKSPMAIELKRILIELLLEHSKSPSPIEISFLMVQYLEEWRYPTPYDLHYSEDWRERYQKDLSRGTWRQWSEKQDCDEDLAAHLTSVSRRGICLWGKATGDIIPIIPQDHFIDSLINDFRWSKARKDQIPIYLILNSCRVYEYLRTGSVVSKAEGGEWALSILPSRFKSLVTTALDSYKGSRRPFNIDKELLDQFIDYIEIKVDRSVRNMMKTNK